MTDHNEEPQSNAAKEGLAEARRRIAACAKAQADSLDLGGLQLQTLPEEIYALTWLKQLYLGCDADSRKSPHYGRYIIDQKLCNALGALPGALFLALTQLEVLDLARNRLTNLPSSLATLTQLTNLDLWGNEIGDAGAAHLAGLTHLTNLNLGGNNIGDAGAPHLAGLTHLTNLNLMSNEIGDAGAAHLAGLTLLTNLNLWGNNIGDAGAAHLAGLTLLTNLDLMSNEIGDITPLAALDHLENIDLSHCALSNAHPTFWRKPSLREATLCNAKLGDVPAELLSQNYGDNCLYRLRRYFDAMERGAPVELRDVKVMILGNGQIGKTQLRRQLCGEDYDESVKTTHGVDIALAELPAATSGSRAGDDPTPLKIWDFGGQDIYLGTHALFLRTRAVFPIVWTPSAENTEEHTIDGATFRNFPLRYWVNYVSTMGGINSPVVLVEAQCDEPGSGGEPPVDTELRGRFGFRPPAITYSAKTGRNHDQLISALRDAVDYLAKQRGVTRVGEGWAAVKTELENMHAADRERDPEKRQHRTLDTSEFLKICRDTGSVDDPDEARVLLGFLHDLGTVFHQPGTFNDLIILDQQWALDAIYAVFDRESGVHGVIQNTLHGRFTRSELGARLWNGKFSEAEQQGFIAMMRACDICFTLRDDDEIDGEAVYVAPDLLPDRGRLERDLADRWDDTLEPVSAEYEYDLLPPNLLRGVMAKVGEKAGLNALYWRGGFYFWETKTGARGMVEEVREDPKDWAGMLRIQTQKGNAADLLSTLCDLVEVEAKRIGVEPTSTRRPEPEARERVTARADAKSRAARGAHDEGGSNDAETGPVERLVPGPEPTEQEECFISYAHADERDKDDIAQLRQDMFDRVCSRLNKLNLKPVFDTEQLPYGESISAFMRRMAKSPTAVIILSKKYLQSPYCMFELLKIFHHCRSDDVEFQQRIRAVTLPDAKLKTLHERLSHTDYWKDQHAKYDALIKTRPEDLTEADFCDYKHMAQFALEAPRLLGLVKDALYAPNLDAIDKLTF